MKIEAEILGQPPRTTHQSGTRYSRYGTYKTASLKKAELWYRKGLEVFIPKEPIQGAVRLEVVFKYKAKVKKEIGAWKTTKPDTDNLIKTLKDIMTRLDFWEDDAQVVHETCKKIWSDNPGIEIKIESLEENGKTNQRQSHDH